jgi:hypothetical protein
LFVAEAAAGRITRTAWLLLALAVLFVARFVWLSTGGLEAYPMHSARRIPSSAVGPASSCFVSIAKRQSSSELPPVIAKKIGTCPPLFEASNLMEVARGLSRHLFGEHFPQLL